MGFRRFACNYISKSVQESVDSTKVLRFFSGIFPLFCLLFFLLHVKIEYFNSDIRSHNLLLHSAVHSFTTVAIIGEGIRPRRAP